MNVHAKSPEAPTSDVGGYRRQFIFSAAIRLCHWLRAFSVIILMATGFYLAWPFLVAPGSSDVLVQGTIRFTHLTCGFLLCAVTLARLYLFLFGRSDNERRSVQDVLNLQSWKIQLKSYFWRGKLHKVGEYGPLQFVAYFGITVIAILSCITGLVLYANVYHEGMGGLLSGMANTVIAWAGGLAQIRLWHHYFTWAFLVFLLAHIYMVVWSGIRFKHNSVDSMVSGYNYYKR